MGQLDAHYELYERYQAVTQERHSDVISKSGGCVLLVRVYMGVFQF